MWSAENIKKAVSSLRALRPAYGEIFRFYEQLFLAQESAKKKIQLPPIELSADLLATKRREGFSLLAKNDFTFDHEASEALLFALCRLTQKTNTLLAQAGANISRAVRDKRLKTHDLFFRALDEDKSYFERLAKQLEADAKALAFLANESIRPSLCVQAAQVAPYLEADVPWERGICPLCGSLPVLSVIREEGQRFLFCGFCGHEWPTARIYCPFCDNREQKRLYYFFPEEEKDNRVDVCDKCNRYIKTIIEDKIQRPFYPFLEQIGTLHLDMLARERGLESGASPWIEI